MFKENLSEEDIARREARADRIHLLADEEAALRMAVLEPHISTGFTLERKPPSHLLVLSCDDIPLFKFDVVSE